MGELHAAEEVLAKVLAVVAELDGQLQEAQIAEREVVGGF